jgi:hypothetical protein
MPDIPRGINNPGGLHESRLKSRSGDQTARSHGQPSILPISGCPCHSVYSTERACCRNAADSKLHMRSMFQHTFDVCNTHQQQHSTMSLYQLCCTHRQTNCHGNDTLLWHVSFQDILTDMPHLQLACDDVDSLGQQTKKAINKLKGKYGPGHTDRDQRTGVIVNLHSTTGASFKDYLLQTTCSDNASLQFLSTACPGIAHQLSIVNVILTFDMIPCQLHA